MSSFCCWLVGLLLFFGKRVPNAGGEGSVVINNVLEALFNNITFEVNKCTYIILTYINYDINA